MFGYAVETPQEEVRPFEAERFVDPQARDGVHRAAAARRRD